MRSNVIALRRFASARKTSSSPSVASRALREIAQIPSILILDFARPNKVGFRDIWQQGEERCFSECVDFAARRRFYCFSFSFFFKLFFILNSPVED